jgi:hypothetical protein
VVAAVEFETFVCAEALYLRAAASSSASVPVAIAAASASASSAPVVLWAMFDSRLFDHHVLGLVALYLGCREVSPSSQPVHT